jgi:membrane protein DedA with SNARE-associated domain
MTIEYVPLIEKYGYLATFVGTLAEGESLLILSGLCAHRGYMSLPAIIAIGAVGGALGDVGFFLLGRLYGAKLLIRYPRYAPAADRVRSMIERFPVATILGVRFMYGLRTVGPAVIGTTRVSLPRFVALNLVGAVAWSICWAGAGYLVGKAGAGDWIPARQRCSRSDKPAVVRIHFGAASPRLHQYASAVMHVAGAEAWRATGREFNSRTKSAYCAARDRLGMRRAMQPPKTGRVGQANRPHRLRIVENAPSNIH